MISPAESTLLRTYLRTIPYFRQVEDDLMLPLVSQAVVRDFAAGSWIFGEQDAPLGLWVVQSGRVKIFKLNLDGQEHVLHILGDGNTFNDIAALDGRGNPANAAALSDCRLWLVPAEILRQTVHASPELSRQVIQHLTVRVRALVDKIDSLAMYSVPARLARFLLQQAENPSLSGPGVTRTAIAAHLATTPQTISNVLRVLEDEGAIEFDRHQIIIVDEDILRRIAMS